MSRCEIVHKQQASMHFPLGVFRGNFSDIYDAAHYLSNSCESGFLRQPIVLECAEKSLTSAFEQKVIPE